MKTKMKTTRKIVRGYVLELRRRYRKPSRAFYFDYQSALAAFGRHQNTIVMDDEDWPRLEALLATTKSATLHKAKFTVEWPI